MDNADPHFIINDYAPPPQEPESEPKPKTEKPKADAPKTIEATPFPWPDCATIPPRQWLYGRHLIRGYVSTTIAPGAAGKSSLITVEALSMVSGRALLHSIAPAKPLNVWWWNGEDPRDELYRRVAAAAKHHRIGKDDCAGQLFIDSGREVQIVIAETTKSGTTIARPAVDQIKATIRKNKLDVFIVDPFVSSHRVSENDNNAIDMVAREWARIADETGCAIDLVHHSRKTGGGEVTVEDARGASALISAARDARVLNPMSADEAEKAGVEPRFAYFRVDSGAKANMAPRSEKAQWFHFVSVDLENGGGLEVDSVGVVTEWKWPDALDGLSVADLRKVQDALATGEHGENVQAKDWAGIAVAETLGLDLDDKAAKARVKSLLRTWIKNKALRIEERPDGRQGRNRKVIVVGARA